MAELRVVESRHSTWTYHLSDSGDLVALCGALTMSSPATLEHWGTTTLGERYCWACEVLASKNLEQEREKRDE
ncbi:hypothetical protein [Nocardia otitidiscaviarum]|uniref:hypothetical protein n=1 Tax=Nocardia otitidiscaviarum TaxID=1823 RepID=UPI0011DE2137|nr:hypothetical protein [Nocardia otitidiscaviarum]